MNNSWMQTEEQTESETGIDKISTDLFLSLMVFFVILMGVQKADSEKINKAQKNSNQPKHTIQLYVNESGKLFLDENYKQKTTFTTLQKQQQSKKINQLVFNTAGISLKQFSQIQAAAKEHGFSTVSYYVQR